MKVQPREQLKVQKSQKSYSLILKEEKEEALVEEQISQNLDRQLKLEQKANFRHQCFDW